MNYLLIFDCKKLKPESECYINGKLYERRGPSSEIIDGKGGGGRKDFAQAGGVNKEKIEETKQEGDNNE